MAAGPAPSRKARARWSPRRRSKRWAPSRTNANDGAKATTDGEEAAGQAGGGVADDGDGLHDRAGGDLAERDGVEELGRRSSSGSG